MSFSADWLALRAPFDSAARSTLLEARLTAWARERVAGGKSLDVVDLGAGSGNNLEHLASRLPGPQRWTLVDGDAALLETAARRHPGAETRQADLAGNLDSLIPAGTDLVTASALIDLVSRSWLSRLAARVRTLGCGVLIVLTYDGRIEWDGETEADREATALVNRHQRGDKGLGPALGPDAPDALSELLPGLDTTESDWAIGAGDTAFRTALVDGWAGAAREIAPDRTVAINAWRDLAASNPRHLVVGHKDQLWLPPT